MRTHPPVHRALDVVISFVVYGVIGRRPSGVYVDRSMNVTTESRDTQPLWDLVFEEFMAEPGHQIQDRPGGIVLVDGDGMPRQIQLTPPWARSIDGAFTHAELVLISDRELAERLVAEGRLAIAPIRRVKISAPPATKRVFAFDHPLVIATSSSAQTI